MMPKREAMRYDTLREMNSPVKPMGKRSSKGILMPNIRFWIRDQWAFLNAINVIFWIKKRELMKIKVMNIVPSMPFFKSPSGGEITSTSKMNDAPMRIVMTEVIACIVLYSSALFSDRGMNLIRAMSSPSLENTMIEADIDRMAAAMPISLADIVRAAAIQNIKPKKELETVFKIMDTAF
jgi:hypothetical protein